MQNTTEKPTVRQLDERYSIAYRVQGSGEPVVLIHGSLCDYRFWSPQLTQLAENFCVWSPSLAHYYPRLPSAARVPFDWLGHVEQLASFIRKVVAAPVHLVGHSRGGCLAYQLALRFPDLPKSLTLIDPGGPLEGQEQALPESVMALRRQAVGHIQSGRAEEGLKLFVDSVTRPGAWVKSSPGFKRMARDNAHTLSRQLADPLPSYKNDEAERLVCPALLVDGELSPRMYRTNVEALAKWIPMASHRTIAGASHGLTATHRAIFNDLLTKFIKSTNALAP